jgi:AcrR family transcriptional regulator
MQSAGKAAPAGRTRLTAAERRASILDGATEVFAAAGYRAAKVSDVAARVGVTEPVIFQNFGSKAALFAAVLDRLANEIHAEMHSLAEDHDPAASVLVHILGPRPAGRSHGSRSHRMLFADAASLVADPGASEAACRVAPVLAGHLADLVRRGQAEGDIAAGLDAEAAAWMLLSVLSTRSLRAVCMPGPGRLESGVADVALRALLPAISV